MPIRHFLQLTDLSKAEIDAIIVRAQILKAQVKQHQYSDRLKQRTMVLVFEKTSTRTRVSFETGMAQLGGNSIFLAPSDSQMSRGEPIKDTARVLSRMTDLIVMRTGSHERIARMAEYSRVPVINALSDFCHPCQQLADLQTYSEHRGSIEGQKVAWIGDGNNVCHSWMNASRACGFQLAIASPKGFEPDADHLETCAPFVDLGHDPKAAARDASLIVTDTWASMGQEEEKNQRQEAFGGFCVDEALMALAKPDALFMHCLPAYREMEVTDNVLEGPQSVVWDQAENRLHAQKALIEFLLNQNLS
jgi:ornithine carbamoyltransferase